MALQGSYSFNGITIPTAYVRVQAFIGSKFQGWHVNAAVYATQAIAETPGAEPVTSVEADAAYVTNQNPYLTVYNALAALPALTGFTTV